MTAYCLWDVREIHDQDAMNDYVARVTETVTAYGGEYVVVGGPWQIVEGDWHPAYPVLIVFPSLDRAHEWYSSELYAPLRELRHAASVSDAVFFDGTSPGAHAPVRSADAPLSNVAFDLYRDVHKGIRRGLFDVTEQAGHVDSLDDTALGEVHQRIEDLLHLLDVHAAHEDEYLGPLIERHLPVLAVQLQREHAHLDVLTAEIRRQLAELGHLTGADRRIGQHRLYLSLSEFVAAYLQHQTTEEVEVLPAFSWEAGLDEMVEANAALVAAISPGDMDGYMRLIVPAVNPLDLAELYAGMRAGAPDDAFATLLDIARNGLDLHAYDRLTGDLALA
jgi:uncharacterized protein (DUF1330 family)